MRQIAALLFFLCAIAQGASLPGHPAAITITATVAAQSQNISSCTAPCSVFVDATATTYSYTSAPFTEIYYFWDFGDTGGGTWTYGSGSYPNKNNPTGALAAYVYTTPGTYEICALAVYNNAHSVNGGSCPTPYNYQHIATVIVVSPDATTYPSTGTICYSIIPDYSGCPSGATHKTTADLGTICTNDLAINKRLLLHAGETFTAAATCKLSAQGPWTIGTYPTDRSAGRAVVNGSAAVTVFQPFGAAGSYPYDGRVMDLEVTGVAGVGGTVFASGIGAGGTTANKNFDGLLWLNLYVHDIADGPNFDSDSIDASASNTHVWRYWTWQDSILTRFNGGTGTHAWFGNFEYSALLGDSITHTDTSGGTSSEHIVRTNYCLKCIFNHLTLAYGSNTKETLALRGAQQNSGGGSYFSHVTPAPSPTQYTVISDNDISQDGASQAALVIGPTGPTISTSILDTLIERNYFHSNTALASVSQLTQNGGARSTFRNNAYFFNVGAGVAGQTVTSSGMTATATSAVYNESYYNAQAQQISMWTASTGTTTTLNNVLMYGPNGTSFAFTTGTGTVNASNNTSGSTYKTNPLFAVSSPATPLSQWKPGCTASYPCAQGIQVPNWYDALGAKRPLTPDIGAVQH